MIYCFTGHRCQDLPSKYIKNHPWKLEKFKLLSDYLTMISPAYCISGGALGWDQWGIYVCQKLNIPYKVYIPFPGQDSIWPEQSKRFYKIALDKATEVRYISKEGYEPRKMQRSEEHTSEL